MRILIMVPVLLAATLAGAKTFWIKNGTTDWTKAESYFDEDQKSPVGEPPGEGDLVAIPSGTTTVYLDAADTASWELVNRLAQIAPRGTSSKLVITVAEGEATLSVPVTIFDTLLPGMTSKYSSQAWSYGTIVKMGDGDLALTCVGTKKPESSNSCYDYFTGLDVRAGSLYFPQSTPGKYSCYFGRVGVAEGATLFTCRNENDSVGYAATYVKSLSGAGVVTNTFETGHSAANSQQYYFGVNGTETDAVFSGRVGGAIRAIVPGVLNTSGTESTAYGSSILNGGEWTVASIGLKAEPSSLGAGNWLYVREAGGTLHYAGEGETVSRQFGFSPVNAPFVIDAGPVGGLDFVGKWENSYSTSTRPAQMRNLVLTGSNTVPCTVNVEMETETLYQQGVNFTCYMTKEGSGTWRFKDCAKHVNDNGFWVKEGTLQFDSIDEAGRVCALGTSTNLTDGYIGDFDPSRAVAYAFKLGGAAKSGAANEATFEFTGTNRSWCGSRPFVLAGDARIRNDTERPLRLCNLSALAGLTPTVTFCGLGTAGNEFYDIVDGASPVSVRKTGSGSWTLGGDLSFSGTISVDEGTLTVRKEGGKYDWFRWTLKEEQGETHARFRIEEFGLFAEGTNRLTSSMLCQDDGDLIRPGQAAIRASLPMKFFSSTSSSVSYDGTLTHMLENAKHNGMNATVLRNGKDTHSSVADPETWIPVLIRLLEDAPEVVSFDYVNLYGDDNVNSISAVKAYSLEGSVNGLQWDELYATNDAPLAASSWRWTASNEKFETNETRAKTSGYPIRGHSLRTFDTLSNLSGISVGGGATFQIVGLADGETIPLKDGVTLTVDCGKATGTAVIRGVSFPASGTLHVANCPRGRRVAFAMDTTDAEGFENVADWDVTGLPNGYAANVTPTGVTIVPPGALLIIR